MPSLSFRYNTGKTATPVYLPRQISATTGPKTVDVGAVAVKLLSSNPERMGFILVNNGGTDAYIGVSSNVVAGNAANANGGLLLKANGGSLSLGQDSGWAGDVYAITAAGSTVVAVFEW